MFIKWEGGREEVCVRVCACECVWDMGGHVSVCVVCACVLGLGVIFP